LKKRSQEKDTQDKQLYQSMFNKESNRYNSIVPQIRSSITDETNLVTIQATVIAILHEELNAIKNNQIARTVIYVVQSNGDLLLGPFQGKRAVQRIKKGVGICWNSIEKRDCIISENKDQAGSSDNSLPKSEIAAPIVLKGKPAAVIYLDSNNSSVFTEKDRELLIQVSQILQTCKWSSVPVPQRQIVGQNSSNSYMSFLWLLFPTSLIVLSFLYRGAPPKTLVLQKINRF